MREKQVLTSAGVFLISLTNEATAIELDRALNGRISISGRDLISM